jgi:membrane protein implicated in regulation of membrane protease activity
MKYYQISLILTFVLVIFEIFTLTFICLGFAAGTLCVAIVQFLTGFFSLSRDVIVFSLGSFAAIVIFRKYFRTKSDQTVLTDDDVNQY